MTRSLRMTEAEYAERSKRLAGWIAPRPPGIDGKKRRVKKLDMGNKKAGKRTDLNNQFFRSSWEANYARYLNLLIGFNKIKQWEFEAETFEFSAIKKGTRFYTPDFRVTLNDGKIEYHEVKGWKHPKGETALRRMAKYFPDKKIIMIDKKVYEGIKRTSSRLIPLWE